MTPDRSLLFLIGYRGTGKTSVGRRVADRLGWRFADADEELQRKHGRSIRAIFTANGENAFRDMEEAVLTDLCGLERCVVATGGGVVLRETNRRRLRDHGKVVWLTADANVIWRRLQSDLTSSEHRPNLTCGGFAEVMENLRVREPLYRECAAATVPTDERSVDEVAQTVFELIHRPA
jgi:shikimate kinase